MKKVKPEDFALASIIGMIAVVILVSALLSSCATSHAYQCNAYDQGHARNQHYGY